MDSKTQNIILLVVALIFICWSFLKTGKMPTSEEVTRISEEVTRIISGPLIPFVLGCGGAITAFIAYINWRPGNYTKRIGRLLKEAVAAGPDAASKNAEMIVIARNQLRKSMYSLSHELNGDLDKLADLTNQQLLLTVSTPSGKQMNRSNEEIFAAIVVLHEVWPTKSKAIDDRIKDMRKLFFGF